MNIKYFMEQAVRWHSIEECFAETSRYLAFYPVDTKINIFLIYDLVEFG